MYKLPTMIAGAGLVAAALGSSAEAAVQFNNRSDRAIVFEMTCAGGSQPYRWVAPAGDTLLVSCVGGASLASRISTTLMRRLRGEFG